MVLGLHMFGQNTKLNMERNYTQNKIIIKLGREIRREYFHLLQYRSRKPLTMRCIKRFNHIHRHPMIPYVKLVGKELMSVIDLSYWSCDVIKLSSDI